ncbi:MAG TPA: outer membrane beta-barrel protein [Ignavibacteriaceae bacterium]|nr:outer membrane beta-barrel protein [Ignavibacteriaceae bacterium]
MIYKIFAFLILLSCTIAAQETDNQKNDPQHNLGLLFSINDFKLNSFKGGAGLKFLVSDQVALLAVLKYSHSLNKLEPGDLLSGSEDKISEYGFNAGTEVHFYFSNNISPYLAGVFGISSVNKNEKTESASYLMPIYSNEKISTSFSFSFELSFGLEYFLWENVSLSGQYNLGLSIASGEEEYKNPYSEPTKMNIKAFDAGISSGELIIAVYF